MVTGTNVAYVGGTSGRPIPLAHDGVRQAAHQPQAPKPAGLDWDALTPTCTSCGQKSGQLGPGDLCPACRGITPTKTRKTRKQGYAAIQLPEDELLRRFTAPVSGPDDTALGRALAELEATDPKVAAAAAALDDATARITRPDDHIRAPQDSHQAGNQGRPTTRSSAPRATSPSSTPGSAPGAGSAAHREKNPPAARETRPAAAGGPGYTDAANLDAQIAHAARVLRDTATSQHPATRLLRLNAIAALEALHLFHQLNPQTPAPASHPRPAGAGQTPPERDGRRSDADRPAARTEGEAVARPATTADTRPRRVMDTDEARRQRRRTSTTSRHSVTVDEQAIVREYEAGETAPAVAARHGILPKRVRAIITRNGGELRDDRKTNSGGQNRVILDDDTLAEIRRLYVDEQQTIQELAARFNRARGTITKALRNSGIQIRPAAHLTGGTQLDDHQKAAIVQRYIDGAAIHDLAHEHHTRVNAIRDIITAAGQTIRPKGASGRNADRIRALGATPPQVRTWAVSQGLLEPGTPGLIPARLIDAYAAAHPTHEHEEES